MVMVMIIVMKVVIIVIRRSLENSFLIGSKQSASKGRLVDLRVLVIFSQTKCRALEKGRRGSKGCDVDEPSLVVTLFLFYFVCFPFLAELGSPFHFYKLTNKNQHLNQLNELKK
jgi:hypothetical protein